MTTGPLEGALMAVREAVLDIPSSGEDHRAYWLRACAAVDYARDVAATYVPRETPKPTKRRGSCPVCHRSYALCSDGSVWAHATRSGTTRCPGSHQMPQIPKEES